jgi:hypothetical protein
MTATELHNDLCRRGVVLAVEDGRLIFDAPAGVLSDADKTALRELKPAILQLLQSTAPERPPRPDAAWDSARGVWLAAGFIVPTAATMPAYAKLRGEEWPKPAPAALSSDFIPAAVFDVDKARAGAQHENEERKAFIVAAADRHEAKHRRTA